MFVVYSRVYLLTFGLNKQLEKIIHCWRCEYVIQLCL